jgi:hypothetical protein
MHECGGCLSFVVYTEGRDTLPPTGTDTALVNRGFVVKINRLIRF